MNKEKMSCAATHRFIFAAKANDYCDGSKYFLAPDSVVGVHSNYCGLEVITISKGFNADSFATGEDGGTLLLSLPAHAINFAELGPTDDGTQLR